MVCHPERAKGESRDLLERESGRTGYDEFTQDPSTPPLRGSARDDNSDHPHFAELHQPARTPNTNEAVS